VHRIGQLQNYWLICKIPLYICKIIWQSCKIIG
jgi:hypothetical protein